MKKKILGGIALLAIAAVAAWNVSLNSQSNKLSGTSLANVEALAQNESENNGVGQITQKDSGRETVYHNGQIEDCRKITIECKDVGTLQCPSYSVAYDDCCSI